MLKDVGNDPLTRIGARSKTMNTYAHHANRTVVTTENSQNRTLRGPLLLATCVAALGGFLFGYDTAVVNGANQFLKAHFVLDPMQEGLAAASAILGCIPGAMFAGTLSDRYGRKKTLFLCAFLFAVSGIFSALPETFTQFFIARFISGLGIGASSMVCPIYIAELAPEKWRGRLGTLFQLGIVTGIFLTLFINLRIQGAGDAAWNTETGWRWMLAAEVVPAALLMLFLVKAPESPRWLIQVGRINEAKPILSQVVGRTEADREIAEVRKVLATAGNNGRFFDVFSRAYRRPLLLAVMLMIFSQLSGINAVIYYSTKIFAASGADQTSAFSGSAWVGLVNLLFTLVAIAFVDKAGRRPLLLIGTLVQGIALGWMGWMLYSGESGSGLLLGVIAFIGAFAMAMGPISWLFCSEIFPAQVRGRAMSIATFSNWVSCFLVAQTFPMLNDSPGVGPGPTFWIYAAFSLLSFLFVWKMLPETKGQTLEAIEASWKN